LSGVRPAWQGDDRFWYRVTTAKGSEAILIDPAADTRAPCDLPACAEPAPGGGRGTGRGGAAPRTDVVSPDRKRSVFIRDWNLWVRDAQSGQETALTTDGDEGVALLSSDQYRRLLGLRLLDTDSLRVVYAARLTGTGVIVSAGEEDLENLIGYVADEANHETDNARRRGLDDVIRILDAALVAPE